MQMEVTPDERDMILAYRRNVEAQRQKVAVHLLEVAFRFECWCMENGAGATYSTFTDDFGYPPQEGEDRPALYEKIRAIIAFAHEKVSIP